MGYVISLGGSSIFTNNKYDNKFIKSLSFLKRYKDIIIVVGGGIKARTAILQANNLNNFEKDLIAINITKENAKFVATNLKYKYNDISCAKDILKLPKGKVICGGLLPGLTTDAISALIAEAKGYNLINLTNVKGVYTKDPKKHKDAKLIKKIEINELIKLVLKTDKRMPGTNTVLDLISLFIVRRSKIPTTVFLANSKLLSDFLETKKTNGTQVIHNN